MGRMHTYINPPQNIRHTIDESHNMQVLLAACRELMGDYNRLPDVVCVFAQTVNIFTVSENQ